MRSLWLLILLITSLRASAIDLPANFQGKSEVDLFDVAWRANGLSTKAILRRYLATHAPDSPEGLFSKAWLAGQEGSVQEELAAYRECRTRAPTFVWCFAVGTQHPLDQAGAREELAAFQQLLKTSPSVSHYEALFNAYFTLSEALKDRAGANALLKEWEPKLAETDVVEMIRGVQATLDHDSAGALRLLKAAMGKEPRDLEARERYVDLQLAHADASASPEERTLLLQPIVDFIRAEEPLADVDRFHVAAAYAFLGDKLRNVYNADVEALQAYGFAFTTMPTAEVADPLYLLTLKLEPRTAAALLDQIQSQLPDNYLVLRMLGRAYAQGDPDRARKCFERALAQSPLRRATTETIIAEGQSLLESVTFEYDAAFRLYQQALKETPDEARLIPAVYLNRRNAGDFRAALDWLQQYPALGTGGWRADERRELGQWGAELAESDRITKSDPFLQAWGKQFGDAFVLDGPFEPGSAALPPAASHAVEELAEIARLPEAKQEVYRVAVPPESAATTTSSRALALARARAVAGLLHDRLGIPNEQLLPVVEAGGHAVEVTPVGNLGRPSLSVTGALEADDALAITEDGRMLAVGTAPMELWDVPSRTRLRDLGPGGPLRAFSPDGRHLAVADPHALRILDVSSGAVHAIVPEISPIEAIAWSPAGAAVVWVSARGTLSEYDIGQRRRTRLVSLQKPGVPGRAVLWTSDGRFLLTGQVDDNAIEVFDARTFKRARTLQGPHWTDALAETRDGRFLVCADHRRTLTVWDTAHDWVMRQVEIPVRAGAIVAHPSNDQVLITDAERHDHAKVLLFDLAKMHVLATYEVGGGVRTAGWGPEGATVLLTDGRDLAVLDPATLAEKGRIDGPAARPRAGVANARLGLFLSADDEGLRLWNTVTGHSVKSWKYPVDELIADGPSGVLLVQHDAPSRQTHILRLDLDAQELKPVVTVSWRVDRVDRSANVVALAGVPYPEHDRNPDAALIAVYSRTGTRVLHHAAVPIVDGANETIIEHPEISAFAITPDGREVFLGTRWVGPRGPVSSAHLRLLELGGLGEDPGRAAHLKGTIEGAASAVSFRGEAGAYVAITSDAGTAIDDVRSGKRIATEPVRSGERGVSLPDGTVVVWGANGIREMKRTQEVAGVAVPGSLVGVGVYPAQHRLVALTSANELRFFSLDKLTPLLSISLRRDRQWFAWTPDNQFVASEAGTERVAWAVGDLVFDFSKWSASHERPGLLAGALGQ